MSIFSRIGRFGLNKLQPESIREASRETLREGKSRAFRAFRPERIDREGILEALNGRHEDEGRQAFLEMMRQNSLSKYDLPEIKNRHARMSTVHFLIAFAFFILATVLILAGKTMMVKLGALPCIAFALGFSIRAVQFDYAAWQVERRSFPGFRAYFMNRFISG